MIAGVAGPPPDRPPAPTVAAVRLTVAGRIDRLVSEIGTSVPVAKAMQAFVERLGPMCNAVDAATEPEQLVSAAHTLAGSAETLGAVALGAVARQIMDEAAEGDAQPSESLRSRLSDEVDAAEGAVRAELQRRGWDKDVS